MVLECIEDVDIDRERSVQSRACHARKLALASLEFGRIEGMDAACGDLRNESRSIDADADAMMSVHERAVCLVQRCLIAYSNDT